MTVETSVHHHYSDLVQYIETKVPKHDAADIAQNVCTAYILSEQKGTPIRNTRQWMLQVSRNRIADYYRDNAKRADAESWFHPNPETDNELCICDVMEDVIQILLPRESSEVLILSDIKKIQQKDIANSLNLSYETTKSRIQRARKQLRKIVATSFNIEYGSAGDIVSVTFKEGHQIPSDAVTLIKKLKKVS